MAVPHRHHHVHQDGVKAAHRRGCKGFHRLLSVGGFGHLYAHLVQQKLHDLHVQGVVFGQQHPLSLQHGKVCLLLLRQDLLKLDLYGTIRAAVSTFDTFNHIPDLDTAIANAGFFMEKGGVFLFDMNTPYKHQKVLGDNAFTFEEEDASCVWRNHYNAADRRVEITVDIDYHETGEHFHEEFCEYTYDLDTIRAALEKHGFALESVCDGETFGPLTEESQRYFFCATKQYTQLEE